MNRKQKINLIRIIASALILIAAAAFHVEGYPAIIMYAAAYLIIGYDTIIRAGKGIINLQPFDECFLMAVATVGAAALGDYKESVAVMLFYQIGEFFEHAAVGKSRRNISALMDIRPDYANVYGENGELVRIDPDDVKIGTEIVVKPGEKIPIDGVVTEGKSTLDTVALTGESVPRGADAGDEVLSGCVNMTGLLKIRTTRPFGESTASKILDLVENASSSKSKSEDFIAKFARVYTPAVCFAALALAIIPPVISLIDGGGGNWSEWVYRALTFLVISCPCALVISIPLSFFAGLGGASSAGVLIKGSNYMETLSKVTNVVFDKTGTMTKGVFEVTEISPVGIDKDALLEYAALAETFSTHPIGKSIIRAYGKTPDPEQVSGVEEISGCGVTAKINGKTAAVGNHRLMERLGVEYTVCKKVGTVVYAALDGKYCGYILISDIIKPEAKDAIALLKNRRVKNIVMLTGDNESAAEDTAKKLGIERYYSRLLPEDKVSRVEELLAAKDKGEMLAFVGDGINDAPVLARADVGIAMGAMGSDAAIEAADVVLMDDDPRKIAKAIGIASKCMRIVYQNIVIAIAVKFICLALGALGYAGMWAAIFADVGVMVICVLNAVRALDVSRV